MKRTWVKVDAGIKHPSGIILELNKFVKIN